MALLLLDNASEVLMYRSVVDVLQHDDIYDRMFSYAREWMPKKEYEKFKAETSYELIPKSRRKAILRYYDEKVDFLIERGNLEEAVGGVLKRMHRYRNEAYHRDAVRKATIKPAVILLYELVCHLLETLKPGWMSYSSGDNWSEFCQKYKLDNYMSVMHGGLENIVASLRDSTALSCTDLGKLLSEHVHDRIEDMGESLEFIIKNTTGGDGTEWKRAADAPFRRAGLVDQAIQAEIDRTQRKELGFSPYKCHCPNYYLKIGRKLLRKLNETR